MLNVQADDESLLSCLSLNTTAENGPLPFFSRLLSAKKNCMIGNTGES